MRFDATVVDLDPHDTGRFLRIAFHVDRRSGRRSAQGVALARVARPRGSRACLRVRFDAPPGRHPTGRLDVLGGRRAGARLHGGARFRFRLERDGAAGVLGSLRARNGRPRGLPAMCRRFERR